MRWVATVRLVTNSGSAPRPGRTPAAQRTHPADTARPDHPRSRGWVHRNRPRTGQTTGRCSWKNPEPIRGVSQIGTPLPIRERCPSRLRRRRGHRRSDPSRRRPAPQGVARRVLRNTASADTPTREPPESSPLQRSASEAVQSLPLYRCHAPRFTALMRDPGRRGIG